MDNIFNGKSIKVDFEAQVTAALMIQSNALIPIKLAVTLCGISRQEINRRIARGTFPKPRKLSRRKTPFAKHSICKIYMNGSRIRTCTASPINSKLSPKIIEAQK